MTKELKNIERIDGSTIESNLIERQLGFESSGEAIENYRLKYKTRNGQIISFVPEGGEATYSKVNLTTVEDDNDAATKKYVDLKCEESNITTVRPHLKGFVVPDDVVLEFDTLNRDLELKPADGVAEVKYYIDGTLYSLKTAIPGKLQDSVVGHFYAFLNKNGQIEFSQQWNDKLLPLLSGYRVSNNAGDKHNEYLSIIADYHGTAMDSATREYQDCNIGVWIESGCAASIAVDKKSLSRNAGVLVKGDVATKITAQDIVEPSIAYMTDTNEGAETFNVVPSVSTWLQDTGSSSGTYYQGLNRRERATVGNGVWYLYFVKPDMRTGTWEDVIIPMESSSTFSDRYLGIDAQVRKCAERYLDFIGDWKVLGLLYIQNEKITDNVDLASFQSKDLLFCGRLEKYLSTNLAPTKIQNGDAKVEVNDDGTVSVLPTDSLKNTKFADGSVITTESANNTSALYITNDENPGVPNGGSALWIEPDRTVLKSGTTDISMDNTNFDVTVNGKTNLKMDLGSTNLSRPDGVNVFVADNTRTDIFGPTSGIILDENGVRNTNSVQQYESDISNTVSVNKEILEAKLGGITESQGLSDVLSKGNDAGGQGIKNIGDIRRTNINWEAGKSVIDVGNSGTIMDEMGRPHFLNNAYKDEQGIWRFIENGIASAYTLQKNANDTNFQWYVSSNVGTPGQTIAWEKLAELGNDKFTIEKIEMGSQDKQYNIRSYENNGGRWGIHCLGGETNDNGKFIATQTGFKPVYLQMYSGRGFQIYTTNSVPTSVGQDISSDMIEVFSTYGDGTCTLASSTPEKIEAAGPKAITTVDYVDKKIKEIDGVRGNFKVGGDTNNYYPVLFYVPAQGDLKLFRNSVHGDVNWRGAVSFHLENLSTASWGHFHPNNFKYTYFSLAGSQVGGKELINAIGEAVTFYAHCVLWLLGDTTYDFSGTEGVSVLNPNLTGDKIHLSASKTHATFGVTDGTHAPELSLATYVKVRSNHFAYTRGVEAGTLISKGNAQLALESGGVSIGDDVILDPGRVNWSAGTAVGKSGSDKVVMGHLKGYEATIGGHNSELNTWSNLVINPLGNVGVGAKALVSKLEVSKNELKAIARFHNTNSAAFSEIHMVSDSDTESQDKPRLVAGSIGSQYTSPDWAKSNYVYSVDRDHFYLKSTGDMSFFTDGLSLDKISMTIARDGTVSLPNATTPEVVSNLNNVMTYGATYDTTFSKQSNGNLIRLNSPNLDSDTISSGVYYALNAISSNSPAWSTAYGYLTQLNYDSNYKVQTYRPHNSDEVWERKKIGGNWSGWIRTDNSLQSSSNTDANTQLTNGNWYHHAWTNTPPGASDPNVGFLTNLNTGDVYIRQQFRPFNSSEVWERYVIHSTPGDWARIDAGTSGSWTPTLLDGNNNPVALSTSAGTYSASEKLVTYSIELKISSFVGNSGALKIRNLPVSFSPLGGASAVAQLFIGSMASGFYGKFTSSTTIDLYKQNGTPLTVENVVSTPTMKITISTPINRLV